MTSLQGELGDTAAWQRKVSSQQLFGGKKVLLIGVPGAFAPVCTTKHLPGFLDHASDIKQKGVDDVCVMAVNDPFVMREWARSLGHFGNVSCSIHDLPMWALSYSPLR